jgi:hypothetical protein
LFPVPLIFSCRALANHTKAFMDKSSRRLKILKNGILRPEYDPELMFAGGLPFGSLQGVHFLYGFLGFFLDDMRSQVAVPVGPLGFRVGAGDAEFPGGENFHAFAAFAFLDDRIALSTVITAPLLGHEGAIHANFDYLADHFATS